METTTIDLRNWRFWMWCALGLAIMVGLSMNIYAGIELDALDDQARLELVQLILNQELSK